MATRWALDPKILGSNPSPAAFMSYHTYILECIDGSLYVGSTNDLARRIKQHNEAKSGAHYTKIRRPVVLRYAEEYQTAREAKQREAEIKTWPRPKKLDLIKNRQKM